MVRKLKLAGVLVLAILTIVIVLQNTAAVETKLLFATVTMPRALLLLLTFLTGMAVGMPVAVHVWGGRPSNKDGG